MSLPSRDIDSLISISKKHSPLHPAALSYHHITFSSQNLPLLNISLLLVYCQPSLPERKPHKRDCVNIAPVINPKTLGFQIFVESYTVERMNNQRIYSK